MRTRNVQKVVSRIEHSRLRESAQGDKWGFCLTVGRIGVLRGIAVTALDCTP